MNVRHLWLSVCRVWRGTRCPHCGEKDSSLAFWRVCLSCQYADLKYEAAQEQHRINVEREPKRLGLDAA